MGRNVSATYRMLRERLEARKKVVLGMRDKTTSVIRQTPGEVLDFMDNSVHEMETSVANLEAQRFADEYRAIEEALERIEKNTFGICKDCEKPISELRLRAHPTAETCIGCAEIREGDRNPHVQDSFHL